MHGPPPLLVAASLAALEGLALLAGAVLQLAHLRSGHVSLGVALAVFFAAYGALLIASAFGLHRRRTWPRGPVLFSQLIMLGLAWGLRDHALLAVGVAIVAVVTIAGLVHPSSIDALEASRRQDSDSSD